MTRYVIDASVAIKWFLPDAADEADTLQALELFLRLRAAEVSLVQPAHWKAEVASVLARRAPTTAAADLDDLNLLEGIQIIDTPMIYRRAVELAPDDAASRAGYGYMLVVTGNRAEAVAQWEAALRLQPDFPGLRAQLQKLRSRAR